MEDTAHCIAGLDLQCAGEVISGGPDSADIGRKAFYLRNIVSQFQDSFTVLEKVVSCSSLASCIFAVV